jgi:uncharacterized RDD family membrane protein YckC
MLGLIIDFWLVTSLVTAQAYLIGEIARLAGASPAACQDMSAMSRLGQASCVGGYLTLIVAVIGTGPLYYTLGCALVGQTVGQRILGLRVIKLDGGDMGVRRGFLRYLGYLLCVATLGIGFLLVLFDDRRMGWHDKLARTCVIYDWKAHQNEGFIARVRKRFNPARAKTPPAPQTDS